MNTVFLLYQTGAYYEHDVIAVYKSREKAYSDLLKWQEDMELGYEGYKFSIQEWQVR